jgi:hypothetical protein
VEDNKSERIDAETFIQFLLNIMRWDTQSEIAVIDRREIALHPWASIPNTLTPDQLLRTLPYAYPLRQMTLRGDALTVWLKAVFVQMEEENPQGLRFAGVARKNKEFHVNGRSIDPTRHYSVITTPFFRLSPTAIKGLPTTVTLDRVEVLGTEEDINTRTLVERWLRGKRYEGVDAPAGAQGDPTFPSLYDKLLWYTATDVNLSFNQTMVSNSASYESEASLTRDELIGLESSGTFRLDARSRFHEWNNVLDLTYAATRTGDADVFSESKDLTFLETAYSWMYLRETYLPGRVWVPVPHGKIRVETELSENGERGYRHLEMTGVLGAVWKLTDTISVSLGYGLGTELLDPDRSLAHGFDLTFEVKRMPLFEIASSPVFFENRLDVFYKDPGTHNTFRALLSSKISFSLSNHLALTVGADAFAFTSDSNAPGFSADFTVGLQGFFATAWQRY